ncbi:MAG: hypothetical protein AAFZ17_01360 [Cyanobacteria bacterium J06650_10]
MSGILHMVLRTFTVKGLIPYAIAFVAVGGVAVAQQQPQPAAVIPPEQLAEPATPSGPRRLAISVSVAELEDLKVAEGDHVTIGQLLADRSRERQRLEAQSSQLTLTLQRLESASITPPQSPAPVPVIASLPDAKYLEEEASIERSKVSVAQAERAIEQKQTEIEYLRSLANLDSIVLEHEQARLIELQHEHTAAVRDYQLAVGRLGSARDESAYRSYQHGLSVAERVESANQSTMTYQRQWAEYEQRLRDRDYQLTQTQLRLDEVTNAIASLAVVRSPYAGRIRRIKWLGQGTDGMLSAEITLMVRSSPGDALPTEQLGVPGNTNPASN